MTWRSLVSGLVMATMAVAPAAAVVCAAYCVDRPEHATGHADGHHIHLASVTVAGAPLVVGTTPHNCDTHSGITTPATRLQRPTPVVPDTLAVSAGPATAGLTPPLPTLLTRITHGPPGHGAATTAPVLRL